jgi:predicted phosphodiesterase
MCGRNRDSEGVIDDRGSLLIGEPQIHDPLNQISKADIRIAVLHHPFDWLADFDRNRVERRLMQGCDFILHGHTYVPYAKIIRSSSEECVLVSTGAAYSKRIPQDPLYICAHNFVHLDFDTEPISKPHWNTLLQ